MQLLTGKLQDWPKGQDYIEWTMVFSDDDIWIVYEWFNDKDGEVSTFAILVDPKTCYGKVVDPLNTLVSYDDSEIGEFVGGVSYVDHKLAEQLLSYVRF